MSDETENMRYAKNSDCFRRLLRVISEHFDAKCDTDDRVAMLEDRVQTLTDEVARLSTIAVRGQKGSTR